MTSATHDIAVQHLTDQQRFVRLVVQREIKGPLEPPQSPRSPLLKGLSPSGYLANRPTIGAYKRPSELHDPNAIHHQQTQQQQSPHTIENVSATKAYQQQYKSGGEDFDYQNGTAENGSVPQPVPAPRRLNSSNSIDAAVNGLNGNGPNDRPKGAASNASQSSGNKSEDDEAQVWMKCSFPSPHQQQKWIILIE